LRAFSVATLNMWNVNEPFKRRMGAISEFVEAESPDVMCLQEVPVIEGSPFFPNAFQRMGYSCTYLASGLSGDRAEGIAICTRLNSILVGGVLLPEGKDRRGRNALAIRLHDAQDTWQLLAITTHLAYRADDAGARAVQASMILEAISQIWSRFGRMPTLLTGDFNSTDEEEAIRLLKNSVIGPPLRDVQAEVGQSFRYTLDKHNTFAADHPRPDRRIDYIFVSDEWEVLGFDVIFDGEAKGTLASDHFGLHIKAAFPL
jgi:endonuclease/exonuclease/phosphatase family metal-dependent hydrolase